MIRKPMEDIVAHQANMSRIMARTSTRAAETLESKSSTIRQKSPTTDRIENSPFFENIPRTTTSHIKERVPRSPRTVLWVLATTALLGAAFFVTNYFSSATVEITPLTYHGHIEHDFTAAKETDNSSQNSGALAFHFISLTDEKTLEVPVTAEQKIQKKAFGKVIIYNSYSKDGQRLIMNTRLESADHKIFRIDKSVVVPGMKVVAGKIQPGTVEVTAYADAPGVEYNIGLGDFTIPGFKGDPRYTKFSARSKTDSLISGGFSGAVKVPEDSVVSAAREELKLTLKSAAIEKARALIPDGMTFFPGSTILKFEDVPLDFSNASNVIVRATASVFFFDTALLTKKIAEVAVSDYQNNPLTLANMSALAFSFLDAVNNVVLSDVTQVRFRIVGDPIFVGVIDTQKIRTVLIGKEKKDFGAIIVGEINVGKADATIRPMWRSAFPLDGTKIAVKILKP